MPTASRTRRRGLLVLTAVVLAGGLGVLGHRWITGQYLISTDNAYVGGHVVQITAQIPGTVTAIAAENNDTVQAGQLLVQLDASDARIALQEAEASLAQAVREVRGLFANSTTLQGQIATREAEMARLQATLQKNEADVRRRSELVRIGAVGREEFEHLNAELASARHALAAARAAVQTARDELAASRVQLEGTTVDNHPTVQRAAARVRAAYLDLHRTALQAPVSGQITQRNVELGQRIQAGTPLMSVVPMDRLWVDANFKESQLRTLQVGQRATLTADVHGKSVVYHGQVTGVGAGTGAAFALLPAQNATGNWIKIVQRVPVRIALDPEDLRQHPLRIGLSMVATVDTRATQTGDGGAAVKTAPAAAPAASAQASEPASAAVSSASEPGAISLEPAETPVHPASAATPSIARGDAVTPAMASTEPDALAKEADAHVQAIIARHKHAPRNHS